MSAEPKTWPWNVPVSVQTIPPEGRRHHLVADAAARAAIAKMAGLPEVVRLEADLETVPHRGNGLRVSGRLSATVGQTCGVTLEPMQSEIDEPVEVLYLRDLPEGWDNPARPENESGTLGDERIEALTGDTVDLGAIATEFLIVGIDPYPRKPEAEFAPPAADESASSPFAALAALRGTAGKKR